jgi:hydrogenase maturation protease
MALKPPNETRTLVIAFGNTLRQDDGVGERAAAGLMGESTENGNMRVIFRQQLTPDLAASIGEARHVIFIDADTGPVPGSISVRRLLPAVHCSAGLHHWMSPAELLAWAQVLYGSAPKAEQVTVSGAAFDFGEGLTPPVRSALPTLLEIVNQLTSTPDG